MCLVVVKTEFNIYCLLWSSWKRKFGQICLCLSLQKCLTNPDAFSYQLICKVAVGPQNFLLSQLATQQLLYLGAPNMLSSNFTPVTHTVTEHSVVTVYCNATGYPQPTLSWTINGQAISGVIETTSKSNSSGPWVVVSTVSFNASRSLAGELNCTATNGILPNGIHSTNLAVQCELQF